MTAVSCPSTSLCIATATGGVWTSTHPAGSSAAWRWTPVGRRHETFLAAACPSISLCVLTPFSDGRLFVSSSPTTGSKAWRAIRIARADPIDSFPGLACASVALCVTGDPGGTVLTSTHPLAGTRAWSETTLSGDQWLDSIACPSVSLCVGVSEIGGVYRSTNPARGARSWKLVAAHTSTVDVACPTVALCTFGDETGVSMWASPGAGAFRPAHAELDMFGGPSSPPACPSVTLCVIGDSGDVSVGEPQPPALAVPRIRAQHPSGGPGTSTARSVAGRLVAELGLRITCPADGPDCPVTGTADEDDYTANIALGSTRMIVRAGHEREFTFTLTPAAARRLVKDHMFCSAHVRILAQAGTGAAVVANYRYQLDAPNRRPIDCYIK
jgi:hypothetical protein